MFRGKAEAYSNGVPCGALLMEQHTIDTYAEKQLSYAATDF